MEKQERLHHSVTELGTIQVRKVTEYVNNDGKITDTKYSDPMTPASIKPEQVSVDGKIADGPPIESIIVEAIGDLNLAGWDTQTKILAEVLADPQVAADFAKEIQTLTHRGIEEMVTYDRVISADGKIAVRRITRLFDEGEQISKKYHRSWIMPTDDPKDNDVVSKALAVRIHTEAVKDAYIAAQEINNEKSISIQD